MCHWEGRKCAQAEAEGGTSWNSAPGPGHPWPSQWWSWWGWAGGASINSWGDCIPAKCFVSMKIFVQWKLLGNFISLLKGNESHRLLWFSCGSCVVSSMAQSPSTLWLIPSLENHTDPWSWFVSLFVWEWNGPDDNTQVGPLVPCFHRHVAYWQSSTVGFFSETWQGQAQAARNFRQSMFTHDQVKAPILSSPFLFLSLRNSLTKY